MALEEQRALEEILIRPNSRTNDGRDGVAVLYRTWVARDGDEIPGTSNTEGPIEKDWEDPEIVARIGALPAQLQAKNDQLQADLGDSMLALTEADETSAQLKAQVEELQRELRRYQKENN